MQDLTPFLLKASLTNKDNKQITQRKLQTNDIVFVKTEQDVKTLHFPLSRPGSTDYAVYNGALATYRSSNFLGQPISWQWLRSSQQETFVDLVDFYGNKNISCTNPNSDYIGIQPCIRLDLKKTLAFAKNSKDFKIEKTCGDNFCYHTIEFGFYPQSYVGDELNKLLFDKLKQNKLTKTGKVYLGKLTDKTFSQNEEYLFNKERYVLSEVLPYNNNLFIPNTERKDKYLKQTSFKQKWVKVEKIKWIIENFDNLPKQLNPNGDGKATYISLRSERVLVCGIPFNYCNKDKNCELWKFSLLRAYLNGLDMYKDKHDISLTFIYDFTKNNFISEAFK